MDLPLAISRAIPRYPPVALDDRFFDRSGGLLSFSVQTLVSFLIESGRTDTCPGLPWVGLGCHTVESVLLKFPNQLHEAVVQRLRTRISTPLAQARDSTPSELVQSGYRDVVRVFVKNEPHSIRKIESGRLRLIMNSSLTDIAVDRVLLEPLARIEVSQWDRIPSKPGMGLDDDSLRLLIAGLPSPTELWSSDAKAWDFTVPEWLMEGSADIEIAQYGVPDTSDAARLCRASVIAANRKVWSLADGYLYEQASPGIQESGSRMTACRNSKMRVLLALHCGAAECFAMGDDALEVWPNGFDPAGEYAKLGFTMELPLLPPGVDFEFCSTHFYPDHAEPTSWPRIIYRLLGHKPDPALLEQFKYELRAHPRLPEFLAFIDTVWL